MKKNEKLFGRVNALKAAKEISSAILGDTSEDVVFEVFQYMPYIDDDIVWDLADPDTSREVNKFKLDLQQSKRFATEIFGACNASVTLNVYACVFIDD